MSLRSPGGAQPPAVVELEGLRIDLGALAAEICRRYFEVYTDEQGRYGRAGADWCLHDNQWLLCWAIDDVLGATDLCEQARWLARVLHARDFPLSRLEHNLRIASDVTADGPLGEIATAVSGRLAAAAAIVAELDLGEAG